MTGKDICTIPLGIQWKTRRTEKLSPGYRKGVLQLPANLKYREVHEWGMERLKEAEISEAELDARLLLEYVCRTDRNTLLVHGDREVSEEEYNSYVNCVSQREKHVPLQYITG